MVTSPESPIRLKRSTQRCESKSTRCRLPADVREQTNVITGAGRRPSIGLGFLRVPLKQRPGFRALLLLSHSLCVFVLANTFLLSRVAHHVHTGQIKTRTAYWQVETHTSGTFSSFCFSLFLFLAISL